MGGGSKPYHRMPSDYAMHPMHGCACPSPCPASAPAFSARLRGAWGGSGARALARARVVALTACLHPLPCRSHHQAMMAHAAASRRAMTEMVSGSGRLARGARGAVCMRWARCDRSDDRSVSPAGVRAGRYGAPSWIPVRHSVPCSKPQVRAPGRAFGLVACGLPSRAQAACARLPLVRMRRRLTAWCAASRAAG